MEALVRAATRHAHALPLKGCSSVVIDQVELLGGVKDRGGRVNDLDWIRLHGQLGKVEFWHTIQHLSQKPDL
jgi:hypothetical protein